MKNIFKKSYLVITLIAFISVSCNDDNNELFNEAPSVRVDNRMDELQSLLLGPTNNGYKAEYFTKNDQRGGFTIFMKFNADGTVRQTSDFDSDIDLANSSYEISLGTTVELVFTTRNHITKATDPETVVEIINGRPAPQGFYGTSVFQYFSNDDGVLTFRDVRNKDTATLILTPTNFTDFDTESIAGVNKTLDRRNAFLPSAERSVFQILRIENADGISKFNLNYKPDILYATPRVKFADGSVTEFEFGMLFTADGLRISPALEFEGEFYTEFLYDVDNNSYISTVNGTTATILFSNEPPIITNDISEIEELTDNSILLVWWKERYGASPLNSLGYQAILDEINQNAIADYGFEVVVNYVDFRFDFNDDGSFCQGRLRIFDTEGFGYTFCFGASTNIVDNKLFLEYEGPGNANGALIETQAQSLIDFYTSEAGLIITTEGSYSSSLDGTTFNFPNLSATMTSVDNPTARIYGYICCPG
ncbi:MAG: DUF4302 domain-containing protein [Flavobacteriaceae bacterium]